MNTAVIIPDEPEVADTSGSIEREVGKLGAEVEHVEEAVEEAVEQVEEIEAKVEVLADIVEEIFVWDATKAEAINQRLTEQDSKILTIQETTETILNLLKEAEAETETETELSDESEVVQVDLAPPEEQPEPLTTKQNRNPILMFLFGR